MRAFVPCLAAAFVLAVPLALAQEARQLNRIPSPQAFTMRLPPGARAVANVRPVSAKVVQDAVMRIAAAWNTPRLRELLADNFYGKDRLLDALNARVPRDAVLHVLSVQGIQTLGQYLQKDAGGREELVSRVSATVRTQVEFNDPRTGFKRLDGTNELNLLVREPAP